MLEDRITASEATMEEMREAHKEDIQELEEEFEASLFVPGRGGQSSTYLCNVLIVFDTRSTGEHVYADDIHFVTCASSLLFSKCGLRQDVISLHVGG